MKLCYKLNIFYLKDMLKYQFCRPNGYQWLNGDETFLGLSRNTHQEPSIQLNAVKNCYSTPHVVILAMHTILSETVNLCLLCSVGCGHPVVCSKAPSLAIQGSLIFYDTKTRVKTKFNFKYLSVLILVLAFALKGLYETPR